MADNSISFALLAKDMASPAFARVGSSAKEAEGKMGGLAGTAAKVGAALGGLALIKGVFTTGLRETEDYQAGLAQLQAGLKSTHDASGMTADGMEKLATKIQGYSGQTDDSIVKSESLLLTFRNIHDQTGKNNDVFTQATKLTADMAARFGGDASDNAVKLGKALNDPVKGLGALSKMGVTFSESQKATIKQMVATGNTLGAQKLILGQVNAAVGGSAQAFGKTLPGQIAIAHRKFEDVSQMLVTKLTPAFSVVMTWVSKGIDFFGKYSKILLPIAGVIGSMVVAYKAWTIAQATLNAVMALNPIGLVVVAIAGLVAGLIIAYKKSETFRDIVKGALHVVSVAFDAVVTAAKAVFGWVKDHWPLLVGIMTGPIGLATYFIATHFATLKKIAESGLRFIVDKFLDAAGWILKTAAHMFGWVPKVGPALKDASSKFDTFRNDVNRALGGIDENKRISVTATAVLTDGGGHPISDSSGYSAYARAHKEGGPIYGPGTGTSDSIMARLSNGEYVVRASAASQHRDLLDAINYGAPGFAYGGPVVNANASAAGFARQTAAWDNSLTSRVSAAFSSMVSNFAASFSAGIGSGVQRWSGLVSQVLGMLGLNPGLLGKVLAQMTTESGGNVNAINLTDSNAAAGHPSQGLMQVIPGTFAAYAGPFAGLGILNPLANVYAGLNYAMHRYGSNLNGLGEGHGYDSGGWLKPGVSLTYNGTGKPEAILTSEQWNAVRSGGSIHVHVHTWDGASLEQFLNRPGTPEKIASALSRARGRGGAVAA